MATATRTSTSTTRRVYTGPYATLVNSAARANALDPFLLAGLLETESSFEPAPAHVDPNDAGIAGINLPSHPGVTRTQAETPAFAIPWAARYLAELKAQLGSTTAALRAYNTGSGEPSVKGNAYARTVLENRTSLLDRLKAALGYVNPVPGGKVIRLDQGIDYQGKPGGAVVAIGNAVVDAVKDDPGGFGRVVYYTLTDGDKAGQQVYVGHAEPDVTAGQKISVGQRVATLLQNPLGNATQPGWTEVGFATGGAPTSHSESDTRSASAFASFVKGLRGILETNPVTAPAAAAAGLLTGSNSFERRVAGALASPFKAVVAPFIGIGEAADKFVKDPTYPFLWLGFMIVGLALIFVGTERLLGRSAAADAKRAGRTGALAVAAPIAAPEEAAVLVGA